MAELRAWAQFLVACRSGTLIEAAADLGIAVSTLSTALKSLERELGLSLFGRLKSGLSPTADALSLIPVAESLLDLEAFARRTMEPRKRPVRVLKIEVALSFALGRVDLALARAIETFAVARPEVLVEVIGTEASDDGGTLAEAWPGIGFERLHLDYGIGQGTRRGKVALRLRDDWVFARRMPADSASPAGTADLAAGRFIVPALAPPLREAADRFFTRHKIGGLRFVEEHPGALRGLLDEYPDAAIFLPRSLIAPRLGLRDVKIIGSDPPLVTAIVATAPTPGGISSLFLRHLRRSYEAASGPGVPHPVISLRQVRYFNLVHRLQRIGAAAHGANLSQPALSEQLRKLERLLDVELLRRQGDGVIPTAAGDRFAIVAKLLEGKSRRLGAGASARLSSKRIAFGILPSVSQHGVLVNRIAEAVLDVRSRHPALKLVVQEAPNGRLQDWVLRGIVGVAIVETGLPHMPRLPLRSSEGLAAVVDTRHRLLPPGPVKFAELLRLPLALPTGRSGLRQLLQTAATERGLKIQPQMEVDALPMVAAILARLPICTVLPPSAVPRELAEGELVAHPIIDPVITRRLFVIYSGERSLSTPERDLVNTLRARLADDADMA